MIDRSLAALILAGIAVTASVPAFAQSAQAPAQAPWPAPAPQPEQQTTTPPPAQTAAPPSQTQPPAAQAQPPAAASKPSAQAPAAKPAPRRERAQAQKPAKGATTIACTGAFAAGSNHEALEKAYDAKNVTFTEIDGGPDGSKLMATVVFPDDPKRRLEVQWRNEAARSDIYRIAITGRSSWTGPKGLRLGMPLAEVEKINGKPFKLQGFDQANSSSALDWQEGALASLPGGCEIGIFFAADPKTPQTAREEAAPGQEFTSNDAAIRALKPIVTEILFGYSQ